MRTNDSSSSTIGAKDLFLHIGRSISLKFMTLSIFRHARYVTAAYMCATHLYIYIYTEALLIFRGDAFGVGAHVLRAHAHTHIHARTESARFVFVS